MTTAHDVIDSRLPRVLFTPDVGGATAKSRAAFASMQAEADLRGLDIVDVAADHLADVLRPLSPGAVAFLLQRQEPVMREALRRRHGIG